ncbi:DUF6191 domain-containing protein [Streptomyces sp. NPDC058001]|uniref:DUF6191 domain-containing protein n=1 Tax=Streptomyces sp. NPDC058001 TaxID=3346300 RepID=UPI0036E8FAA1
MIEQLFAPGRRHTDEERKRLELTRVDLNDGDPGRGPIDLSSGKVVVRPRAQQPPDTPAPESANPTPGAPQEDPPTS